jgi:hypothetical protein
MGVETYFGPAFLVWLAVGVVLVIHGTIVKNRWGVNLRRVECPNCATVMGRVRMPTSGEQAMWGGYTCPTCKCELDKWGRRIARPA